MSVRLVWLTVRTGSDFSSAAETMLKNSYAAERSSGFRLHALGANRIDGTFYQREAWQEQVEDPSTGLLTIDRVKVNKVSFSLTDRKKFNLLLENPPRSIILFLTAMREAFSTLSVLPARVSPMEWAKFIELRTSGQLVCTGMSFAGLKLGNAKLAIDALSSSELRADVAGLQITSEASAQAVRFLLARLASASPNIELHADGRARLSGSNVDAFKEIVDKSLQDTVNSFI